MSSNEKGRLLGGLELFSENFLQMLLHECCHFILQNVCVRIELSCTFSKISNGCLLLFCEPNNLQVIDILNLNFRDARTVGQRFNERPSQGRVRKCCVDIAYSTTKVFPRLYPNHMV
ncbi:hypothetical protein AW883_27565 [Pseudomonas aeruginosa]|nr:hypothetical protein AW882_27490 [Pseudomonas aeruginosa]KWX39991.1 hypothetical protein AW883_27565 [Pseudomonas aeruginosa]KWX51699.1 hypothetical protein AW884_26445 [Pseudomonas aeruginosa]PTZ92285.1 hypothetical protein DB393_00275 [Pseudomonas aeruginosa]